MVQLNFVFDRYLLSDLKTYQKPNGCTNALTRPRFSDFLLKHWKDIPRWPTELQRAVTHRHRTIYHTDYEIGTYPIISEVMDECWWGRLEYELHQAHEIFSWKHYNEVTDGDTTPVQWLFTRKENAYG